MKTVIFDADAAKQMRKLDRPVGRRIAAKLAAYAAGESADLTALKGTLGEFRLRVGDWRVVFDEADQTIMVRRVGHRREIYE